MPQYNNHRHGCFSSTERGVGRVGCILLLLGLFFISSIAFAAELSLEDLITKVQFNQSEIKDMYAETVTTITSNMTMPGQESKSPQKMIQKAKMWTKGQDKSKIEMLSPTRQITIINGDQMAIINPDTGQKIVQDLKKMREKSGMDMSQQMNLEKSKEYFDFKATKTENAYIISGTPKKENKFFSKLEFYIDSEKWVPIKILMYDTKNKPISESNIEYDEISDVWMPIKNQSKVITPMGKMDVEVTYEKVKVNSGLKDDIFKM